MNIDWCLKRFQGIVFVSSLLLCVVNARAEMSVAVFKLKSEQLKPVDCATVTNFLTRELRKVPGYQVIAWEDVRNFIQNRANKMSWPCDDDKCISKVGNALVVDYIVNGDIEQLGDRYLMNLKLVDIQKAETVKNVSRNVTGNIGLFADVLPAMVQELIGTTDSSSQPLKKENKKIADNTLNIDTVKSSEMQTVHIKSSEPGTAFYVDRKQVGDGETLTVSLPVGEHTIIGEKDGYFKNSQDHFTFRKDSASTNEAFLKLLPFKLCYTASLFFSFDNNLDYYNWGFQFDGGYLNRWNYFGLTVMYDLNFGVDDPHSSGFGVEYAFSHIGNENVSFT